MTKLLKKSCLLALCLALSVLVHILSLYAWRLFSTYTFATPVGQTPLAIIDLVQRTDISPAGEKSDKHTTHNSGHAVKGMNTKKSPVVTRQVVEVLQTYPERYKPTQEQNGAVSNNSENVAVERVSKIEHFSTEETSPQQRHFDSIHPLLGKASDFLTTKSEKFTYQISMFGIPIGNAELEATYENGEILITLRVKSNAAISSVYPVDNFVETRHVNGKYILAKIKQQEGAFRSDEEFTINVRKKRVSSFSNINGRNQITTVPTDEVLDTLSGLYYLRNRPLQVGQTELLHVFDSEIYEDVPVEILRKETVRLPNFTLVDTIVIQPLQKSAGIFRRTGDILIWMTDDSFKVPVKIVTSVVLGRITAELVSAESTPLEEAEE